MFHKGFWCEFFYLGSRAFQGQVCIFPQNTCFLSSFSKYICWALDNFGRHIGSCLKPILSFIIIDIGQRLPQYKLSFKLFAFRCSCQGFHDHNDWVRFQFFFFFFLLIKPHSCLHDFQCRYIFGFLSKCFISIFPNNCVVQQYSFICTE